MCGSPHASGRSFFYKEKGGIGFNEDETVEQLLATAFSGIQTHSVRPKDLQSSKRTWQLFLYSDYVDKEDKP